MSDEAIRTAQRAAETARQAARRTKSRDVFEGDHKQVCEGLYSTGRTLEARGDLLATIRAEWRRNRADQRKGARS